MTNSYLSGRKEVHKSCTRLRYLFVKNTDQLPSLLVRGWAAFTGILSQAPPPCTHSSSHWFVTPWPRAGHVCSAAPAQGSALPRNGWQQAVVMTHCHTLQTFQTTLALCRHIFAIGLSQQSHTSEQGSEHRVPESPHAHTHFNCPSSMYIFKTTFLIYWCGCICDILHLILMRILDII